MQVRSHTKWLSEKSKVCIRITSPQTMKACQKDKSKTKKKSKLLHNLSKQTKHIKEIIQDMKEQ